jgi:N4-gp56 family major capsid protein
MAFTGSAVVGADNNLSDLFVNILAQARFTAEEQSLMLGLVTQYNISGQAGKTIQVPKYPAIEAADLTEGTDLSSTRVNTESKTFTVSERGAQVILTDMAAMGAGNPAAEIGTVLGNAIATKMDKDLIGLFSGFGTSVGTARGALSAASLFEAAATLKAAKAPGQYVAVLHPFQAYQIKANLTNTFANPNGGDLQNEAMRSGYVGTIAGIDVYESANIATSVDLGADAAVGGTGNNEDITTATGAVFAPEALAIALKRDFNLEVQRDASLRANELNATAVYGFGELDDAYGVKLLGKAQA